MSSTAHHHQLTPPPNNNGGQLLLQPPTKLLGCLRTVGRPTSKTDPLLVAAIFTADGPTISRVDLKLLDVASGETVARMDRQGNGHFGVTGGLLCVVGDAGTAAVSVLDPATGDVTNIPAYATGDMTSSAYVFGHVPAATGDHKVLRVFTAVYDGRTIRQPCEVLTVVSGDDGEQQRWRPAPSPPVPVDTLDPRHRAVTGGVAHFLVPRRAEYDVIVSFDLAAEQWRPSLLRCPLPKAKRHCHSSSLSLVELNGCLAFVHPDYRAYAMDMWLLVDLEKGPAWVRVESLPLGKILRNKQEIMARPLMVLEDGRIVFWVRAPYNVVRVYNPRTGECEETVDFGKLTSIVGLYRGDLLGLNQY
jgi:F-box interacting protein